MLNPLPPERLTDRRGRPYFLWDNELTLEQFRALLIDPDEEVCAYWLGTLLRQARPDDAVSIASLAAIRRDWARAEKYVGRERPFWNWYLAEMARRGE